MLTLAHAQAGSSAGPDLARLCGSHFLLSWTVPAPLRARCSVSLARSGRRLPAASLTLGLSDGRARLLTLFRHDGLGEIAATLAGEDAEHNAVVSFDPELSQASVDPSELARDLVPFAKGALATALVGTWPPMFGLQERPSYLAFLRQFLLTLTPEPKAAQPVAALIDGRILIESAVPGRVKSVRGAYWLDGAALKRLDVRPHLGPAGRSDRRPLHLVVEEAPSRGMRLLVLQTDGGPVLRSMADRGALPPLGRWWAGKANARDDLRSWLVGQLAALSERGRLLAIEMQRRMPLAVQGVRRPDELPSAEIDLAVCNQAGLLLGGWYRDPDGLVEQVLLHRGDGEPMPILDRLDRFPAMLAFGTEGERRTATGFAGFIPGFAAGAPVLQPRCELRLSSGTSLFLRPAVQPADMAMIRARTLAAVPPQHVTGEIIARSLAPMLAACQAQLRDTLPAPRLKIFGVPPARPAASVVIPLYRVYEFLRVQIAAFAGDPSFTERAELIYVLDSPEHEAEVAHLLGGLHLAYGLPMQLVVMGRNGGFSAACNAGAAAAKGDVLALVNSDVIPSANGWLPALSRKLDRRGGIGAVGPKLIYDDGSLQHAGLFFKRDRHGYWLNHHYFKGMPGNYAPANVERQVPGVTGACMVMPRALFAEVGGFDESYVIGDYEDSDLCLKIRRAGHSIGYVPGVALYHLERQSISKSVDYTRGVASQHNAWLQTARWDHEITTLMSDQAAMATERAEPEPTFRTRSTFKRATAA
jgi:GT2 family glycosyltransferase